ncbi:hypothetical protein OENI_130064 [Oenococcus oeni]|nr:hypothetical protein OENI_130064 [Oenococcus oeni]
MTCLFYCSKNTTVSSLRRFYVSIFSVVHFLIDNFGEVLKSGLRGLFNLLGR